MFVREDLVFADRIVQRHQIVGGNVVGIPLRDLFSPFKRLHSGDAGGRASSLGLGLYIAERIVTAHGGSIEVESSDNAGTFFTVRLPRHDGEAATEPASSRLGAATLSTDLPGR